MEVRTRGILRTLAVCLSASTLIAVLKILYGRSSGSLAFVADGVHALFDSTSTIIGMVSVYQAANPPDSEHPYGHYKFETLSALSLGLLLLFGGYEVGWSGYVGLIGETVKPMFTMWGVGILAVGMVINLAVAKLEKEKAKKYQSMFLTADSLHNQSDFFITASVLVTMICSYFGFSRVDSIVSILIALYLVYLAVRLIWANLYPLVDTSVLDPREVQKIARSVDGVIDCHHIRSRGERGRQFLDLNLHLPGNITLVKAHEITHQVEGKLRKSFPGLVDVIIHTEPHGHPPCDLPFKDTFKS